MSLPVKFSSAISPFESKNTTPVVKVEIINSPLTVASLGLNQVGYLITDDAEPDWAAKSNLTKQYEGITTLVGFYVSKGTPVGILRQDNYGIRYHGSVFPPNYNAVSKEYTFKIIGFGNVRVRLGSSTYAFGSSSTYQALDPRVYNESAIINFNSASELLVEYYTTKDLDSSGFALLWKSEQDTDYNIVSAGITYPDINTSDAAVLPTQTLNYITDVSFTGSSNEISQASFSIPIVKSTNTLNGYSYNKFKDRYEDVLDKFNKHLRKTDIIKISTGFQEDNGTNTFIQKFIGNIRSFSIDRENRNADSIKVNCESFGAFLKDSLNLNYPDFFDYWVAEFAGATFTDLIPDGLTFPTTFDGWPLDKAFKALLIRGGIDPHLFNTNQLFLNNVEAQVEGSNLIENFAPKIVLEKAKNYGNSTVVFSFDIPDDEYRLKSNFGDTIFDYVNKIIEPYGWEWGFHPFYDGAPYLRSRNNPTTVVASEDVGITFSGAWGTKKPNLDVISGTYRETSGATQFVEYSFTGERIDLISVLRDTGGGGQATIVSGTVTDANTTTLDIMSEKGSTVSTGNRIIIEFSDGNVDRIIRSKSGSVVTVDTLDTLPVSGTLFRTAVASAEIRRGATWSTATPVVTGTYVPSYYEHGLERFIPVQRGSPLGGDPIITGTKRMFYHGVDENNAINPTIFNLGTGLTRDTHTVRVTRLANTEAIAGTFLAFNSYFVFDKDRNLPVRIFRTDDTLASGTLLKLDVSNDGEDLRNDVIVVGRRQGVEVPGGLDSPPINPNNPINKFITSRAIDLASIFNPNALNFIGRLSQTILIDPSIGSQDRADYWAVQFLNRFRFPANEATFEALGNPLLEIGDCIFVNDANKSSIDTSTRLWIEDINTRWGQKEAFDTYETTSFPPWESFTPKLPVSISDFEDKAVVDIQITNGTTADSPYDPYSLDESGIFIDIKFDLVVSGYLRVSVFSHDGIFIADLLNPNGDEGKKGWIRDTFGSNKRVTWDGVDIEGRWNLKQSSSTIGKNFFVIEDDLLINSNGDSYGKFYLQFEVEDFGGNQFLLNTKTDSKFIFIRRGEQVNFNLVEAPVSNFLVSPHTGFLDTANSGKGLSISITDTTSAAARPSQLTVELTSWVWGKMEEPIPLGGPKIQAVSPRTPFTTDPKQITNDQFIKYTTNLSDVFFLPVNEGFDFSNWERYFGGKPNPTPGATGSQKFFIGWYFALEVTLTDKSGRTKVNRTIAFWEGPGALSGETASFGWNVQQLRIGGDPNFEVNDTRLFALRTE